MEDKMLDETGQLISLYSLYDPYLIHSGIKGMKWGIRRYQNPDGTLTEEGKRRYGYNLNLKDTSRLNIAKIRKGEARRRFEYEKTYGGKNYRKQADLRRKYKEAKNTYKYEKEVDKGARLTAKGQTVGKNAGKAFLGYGAAILGTVAIKKLMNRRLRTLASRGIGGRGYKMVGAALVGIGAMTLGEAALINDLRQGFNNRAISKYKSTRRQKESTVIKNVGGSEYADRIRNG